MKKTISIVLTAMMVLSTSLLGCNSSKEASTNIKPSENVNKTGLPIVKEKLSLKLAAKSLYNKNFTDLKFFKDLEEKTNINITWDMSPDESWKEKKSLILASGDLPDAFYGGNILDDIDIVKYGKQGLLIPLEGLIDEYAPNLNKVLKENPVIKKQITSPDGHIYSLPKIQTGAVSTYDKLFINKTWLDQLSLKVPTNTEEFYTVLKAFKDNDMNKNGKADEIPFTFSFNRRENGLYSMFGAFGRIDTLDHIVMDGDKVISSATQPEYKEAIKYFNTLYKDGLIDKEAFTHDFKVYISKIQNKETKVGAFLGWSLSSTVGANNKDYVVVEPFKGKDGKQKWGNYDSVITSKNSFSITSACKEPVAAMRWIDENFEFKNSLESNYGMVGITLKDNSDGTFEFLPVPQGSTWNVQIHEGAPGVNGASILTNEHESKVKPNANILERKKLDEFYKPFHSNEAYPDVFYTAEELEKMSTIQTDVKTYIDQMYSKWMINGGIDSDWDAYIKKLKDMKLDELIKIKQAAYDRFKSSK